LRHKLFLLAVLLGALLVVDIPAPVSAQTLLHTLDSPNPQAAAYFGRSIAMGDVNGDGKEDVAVGAGSEDVGDNIGQGRAYVFSGADGTLLFTLDSPNPQAGAWFGDAVAAGDVNGDGKDDIVVGAPEEEVDGTHDQGRVYIFSGADGSLLFTLNTPNPQAGVFGDPVTVGDVNGDGKGDITVGASYESIGGNTWQGRSYVFSGADGSLLFTIDSPNPQTEAHFGQSVAMGDANGDGKGDIAIGAYKEDVGGKTDQGRAYVFSGANASLLFTLDSPNPQAGAYFGFSAAVGDMSGDGKGDIAIGAHKEDVGDQTDQGRAYVFSGANASLLFTLDSTNPQTGAWFGNTLAAGDVNGDGKGDVAIGAYREDVGDKTEQGRAYVFSGANASLLFTLDSPNPQAGAYFGRSVAMGDVNGDGRADASVGANAEDIITYDQGRAYVFSGPPPVGGIAEHPQIETEAATGRSDAPPAVAIGAILAAGALLLAAGAWGVRRRRASKP
jgi:FG-GAP repeat